MTRIVGSIKMKSRSEISATYAKHFQCILSSIAKSRDYSLRKKCPYSEFFWSVFSANAGNIDQKNFKYEYI